MAKIKFDSVEKTLGDAMHQSFIKKLASEKASDYPRMASYLGSRQEKPAPKDSVIEAINEWREELKEPEELLIESDDDAFEKESSAPIQLPEELLERAEQIGKEFIFESIKQEDLTPSEPQEMVSHMYILRKRLLWFIRKRVKDIYQRLGTSKEEIVSLRKKKKKTEADQKRIDELLKKTEELNESLKKELGVFSDEELIEKEKKRHITKRFNIRETWLPL